MKANKYDMILRMYIGKDDYRPAMQNVNNNNGMLEATNAHVAIRMPESYAGLKYNAVEKYPNLSAVIHNEEFKGGSYKVTTDDLISLLMTCELNCRMESDDCKNCSGTGTIECPCCNQDADCKTCDGTGESDTTHPFAKLEWSGSEVFIQKRKFNAGYLMTLYQTAVIHGAKEIEFNFPEESYNAPRGCVINFDDILILIMPIHY